MKPSGNNQRSRTVIPRVKRKTTGKLVEVHIVSDSESIVKTGQKLYRRGRMSGCWEALDHLSRQGYHLHWDWAGHSSIGMNVLCDHLSRHNRLRHGHDTVEQVMDLSVYDVNPDGEPHV